MQTTSPAHGTESCCLHIVNLHPRTSEVDLQDTFSAYGEVLTTTVVRDPHTSIEKIILCFLN
jgi:RNA recognition motif-containing protein